MSGARARKRENMWQRTRASVQRWPAAIMQHRKASKSVPKISRFFSFESLFSPFECVAAGLAGAEEPSEKLPGSIASVSDSLSASCSVLGFVLRRRSSTMPCALCRGDACVKVVERGARPRNVEAAAPRPPRSRPPRRPANLCQTVTTSKYLSLASPHASRTPHPSSLSLSL